MIFGMLVATTRPRQGHTAEVAQFALAPPALGAASAATLAHRWNEVSRRPAAAAWLDVGAMKTL